MDIKSWIEQLQSMGVILDLEDGRLLIDAPDEILIPSLVDELKERKSEIVNFLENSSAVSLVPVAKELRDKPLPLSFAQERLWFLHQIEDVDAAYNIPARIRFKGSLNQAALERALKKIIDRHEILRTRIVLDEDSNPVQLIDTADFSLEYMEVRGTVQECERQLSRLSEEEITIIFDLESALKIRATLIQISASDNVEALDDHLLMVTMHHIASDGWSMGVFDRELGAFYAAELENLGAPFPELSIQYADFSVWQRSWLSDARIQLQLMHWKSQLNGAPALLNLPTDHARPARQSFSGGTCHFVLPEELVQQIKDLTKNQGSTLYMTLLAAFNVLLSRYSGEDDIVIGSPIANRTREEIEPLIGFFVNTLVLRTKLSSEMSFTNLLEQVRETTLSAYQHQDVPFEKLVGELQPERSLSYSPLFQVMFILQNVPQSVDQIAGLEFEPYVSEDETAKYDLTLGIEEKGEQLQGWFNYSTALFEPATIERMVSHFEVLLEGIVAQPSLPVMQLPLLTAVEQEGLLNESQRPLTAYPSDKTVVDLFAAQALRVPESVAVEGCSGRTLDYAGLDKASNRLAHYLLDSGAVVEGTPTRIGVYLDRDVEMLVALLGVMKAGAAYVPLDPLFPADRLTLMAEDAQLSVVITESALQETVPGDGVQGIVLDELGEQLSQCSEAALENGSVDDTAYVIYTSGSTGRPKGVSVGHQALTNFLCSMQAEPGLSESDCLLAVTTLSFDIAALELYLPLITGAKTVLTSREEAMDPAQLSKRLLDSGASVMQATPATWRMLLDSGWTGGAQLKALCGGEALPRELANQLAQTCGELWNMYGPTETTIWSTVSRVGVGEGLVSVGHPIANTQVYVLDEGQNPQPVGVSGELYIGGDGVAQGYLDRPELTAQQFVADRFSDVPGARLYRTGDRARMRADGTLEVMGRLDEQVKLRGYRIEPGEIRARLVEDEEIIDAVVVVREDVPGDARLVAYVVPDSETELDYGRLRSMLQETLPEYMIPTGWMEMDEFPLTPNGKVDRKALPVPDSVASNTVEYEPPETEIEIALAEIWSELLDVERVGLTDNFFALGGHSLKAVQVTSRIRSELLVEMPLRVLFENPQLKNISSWVESNDSESPDPATAQLSVISRDEPLALSYAQERLWFLDQLEGASALYNMSFSLRLRGVLNEAALEKALRTIVSRHEVLRTRIVSVDGREPEQQITQTQLELSRESVSGNAAECESSLRALIDEEAGAGFDLSSDLKIRARLIKVDVVGCNEEADHYHVLLVSMHHIASDGWSIDVCQRELTELYNASCEGRAAELPALPVQYADFAAWQRTWLDDTRMGEQLSYWRGQLGGTLPVLDLPLDYPRPARLEFVGDFCSVKLDADLTRQLKTVSMAYDTTLFNTLLSAFNLLLARLSGQDDILVGIPSASRDRSELEPLIGLFLSTLVVRTDLSGAPTFGELLQTVKKRTLEALDHQDLPFEKLVQELNPERDLSRHPIFQIMFNMMPEQPQFELNSLAVDSLSSSDVNAKFDLTLYVNDQEDGIELHAVYNAGLFTQQRIELMLSQFTGLLQQIAAESEQSITNYSLVTADSKALLPDLSQPVPESDYESVLSRVAGWTKSTPDQIAISTSRQDWSYRQLGDAVDAVAWQLAEQNIQQGDVIAIWASNRGETLASMLSVWLSGGVTLLLDPALPRPRLTTMLQSTNARMVLSADGIEPIQWIRDEDILPAVLVAIDAQSSSSDPEYKIIAAELSSQDPAYIFFTSGSTGKPKGILGTHRGLAHFLDWQSSTFEINASDRIAQLTAPSFDVVLRAAFLPLVSGATLVLPDDVEILDGVAILRWLDQQNITAMHAVPSLAQSWLRANTGDTKLASLRYLFFAGEPLTSQFVSEWRHAFPHSGEIINIYGPTETTLAKSYFRVPEVLQAGVQSIGQALPEAQLAIVRNDRQCGVGESGEIVIRTPFRTLGYIDDKVAFTQNPFSTIADDHIYYTGDLGRVRLDGFLDILGRSDRQIKIRGVRIEPEEIEAALMQHPAIADAAVEAHTDAENTRLIAYLVLDHSNTGGDPQSTQSRLESVQQHLAVQFPIYMMPSGFIELDVLPLTASGKLDRRSLPEIDSSVWLDQTPYVAPQTETELALAEVWRDVLNLEQIGINDNFFRSGGHSLMATLVVSRIQSRLSVDLPLRSIFERPTIAALAEEITSFDAQVQEQQPYDLDDGQVEIIL